MAEKPYIIPLGAGGVYDHLYGPLGGNVLDYSASPVEPSGTASGIINAATSGVLALVPTTAARRTAHSTAGIVEPHTAAGEQATITAAGVNV